MVSDPVYDAFYTKAMATTSFDAIMQILRDCNEYVARQHFDISLLQPMEYALYQPWFKGYNGQHSSLSGSLWPSAPLFLSGPILDRSEPEEIHGTLVLGFKSHRVYNLL